MIPPIRHSGKGKTMETVKRITVTVVRGEIRTEELVGYRGFGE